MLGIMILRTICSLDVLSLDFMSADLSLHVVKNSSYWVRLTCTVLGTKVMTFTQCAHLLSVRAHGVLLKQG